ncbi:hypothetical protein [Vibrio profundi]|uniref:hypothetical protein n=1 Tax=Vibrio profundi TaxID=1774960 RepID=UPI003734EFF6
MRKFFPLILTSTLTSTQSFAFNQFEVFTQVQHTHLTREYESHFLLNDEKNRTYNGLDAKAGIFEIGVSTPMYGNTKIIGSISIGDNSYQNILWINQYSMENTIGNPPNSGGYNEYSGGHLKYKNYKIGIENQTTDMLVTGVYFAKEEIDSRAETLHSSTIPASTYFEESYKLEGYSDIRSQTPFRNIQVGIQNIITLRRSDVSQKFWYNGANNLLSFNTPSFQILSSPYMVARVAPNLSMRMSLTHTVLKGFKQKDVEFEKNTLTQISNVGVDAYSGSQTSIALSANYHF